MFKGIVDGITTTSGTNLVFTPVWNTNNNTQYDSTNNYIVFNNSGYYDVALTLTVEDSATTPIIVQLYANGVAIPTAIAQQDATVTTGSNAITITDTIRVIPNMLNTLANLSVRVNNVATVTGNITVEKRK